MAKRKYAEDLAKELDFTHDYEYFDYIIDSLVNGNRSQVKKLFKDDGTYWSGHRLHF